MYPTRPKPAGSSNRYSAKNISVPVNFICIAPDAKRVSLVGEFNGWDPASHPMKRRPDGSWSIQIQLNHGHQLYMFDVDGERRQDPKAQGIARDERGERVSMIAVS